jgi:hypothetical protein
MEETWHTSLNAVKEPSVNQYLNRTTECQMVNHTVVPKLEYCVPGGNFTLCAYNTQARLVRAKW